MSLDFVDMRRGAIDRYSWIPFETSDHYDHPHWWDTARGTVGDPWFVQVLEAGAEVARVQLDDIGGINPAYANVPIIGPEQLEIQFIEVAVTARRNQVGTRAIQGLTARHSDRRLFAYSEAADEFWASLGWERFDHPDGLSRALFIQPKP